MVAAGVGASSKSSSSSPSSTKLPTPGKIVERRFSRESETGLALPDPLQKRRAVDTRRGAPRRADHGVNLAPTRSSFSFSTRW